MASVSVNLVNYRKEYSIKRPITTAATPNKADNQLVTYQGKDGITALALLRQAATTITADKGDIAFVTSLNGLAADSTKQEYWSFYVNGKAASIVAGSYVTIDSDTISWHLRSYLTGHC